MSPRLLKIIAIVILVLYVLSPFDVLPDFLIGWGWLDDISLGAVLWWYFFYRRKAASFSGPRGPGSREDAWKDGTASGAGAAHEEERSKDPYLVLGVTRQASAREIKQAYRKLAGQYHPDKVTHLGEEFRTLAEKRFKEIQRAYQTLSPK